MQRILIDGRFVGVGDSMTRYTLEILKRLLLLDKENEYTLLVRPQGSEIVKRFLQDTRYKIQDTNKSKVINSKFQKTNKLIPNSYNLKLEVLDIPHYSLLEQTKLLKYLNKEKFDLVHFVQFNHPIRYRGKFVITIHDLTLLGHLYRMEYKKRIGFKYVMKSAIKNSAKILTVSQTSKKDIVDYYKIDPEKVVVTHLAVDARYNAQIANNKSQITKFKEKYGIVGDYVLYTGMWQRHKNLKRMMQAFENVKCQMSNVKNIQLILVGKIDKDEPEVLKLIDEINERIMNNESRIKDPNHNSSFVIHNSDRLKPIITTGFVDEEELPLAYAGALAYCIPSLSEGFGLPPLEAMACGTPVISSNISAMPEILGDAPLYFDPYDVDDIAKKMTKIIEDKELRDGLSRKGLEQVKKYDWQDTAEKTLKVYGEVL